MNSYTAGPMKDYFATTAAIGIIAFLGLMTVSSGTPQVLSPFNLLIVIPYMLGLGPFAFALVPILFCLWCWRMLHGEIALPGRSIGLLAVCILLSAANLAVSTSYGLRYQSYDYVVGVSFLNACWWLLLIALAVIAYRAPRFRATMLFHTALFSWLAWCAFPYMGEVP